MLGTLLLLPALMLSGIAQPDVEARALRDYRAAVESYAQLHRVAVDALPQEVRCRGAEPLERTRQELAWSIREARAHAAEGDVFTAEIAQVIRRTLARSLRDLELDADDVLAAPARDARPLLLVVNEFYPWEAGPPRWRELFWNLPALPPELEYRLVGGDLVLLDPAARLVVDVLRGAVQPVPAAHAGPAVEGAEPPVDSSLRVPDPNACLHLAPSAAAAALGIDLYAPSGGPCGTPFEVPGAKE